MYMMLNFVKKLYQFSAILILVCSLPVVADSIQKPAIMSALSSQVLLTDGEKLNAKAGYVGVGLYGHIVRSKNGTLWTQAKSPVQILLTSVFFLDDKHGWATGHDTVILHTRDGGENWQLQYEDPIPGGDLPKPLLDIYFQDKQHGYAIGAYGLMLKTNNGGQQWQAIETNALYEKLMDLDMEPEPNFNSMTPFGDKLLIVGELGTILVYDPQSTSEALRWTIIESPYVGTYFGVKASSLLDLYIYGLRGNAYRSTDAGASWNKIETGVVANIYDCIELADGNLIFVGASGTVLHLNASGTQAKKHPYPGFDDFMSGQLIKGNEMLLFGSAGVKQLTVDSSQL